MGKLCTLENKDIKKYDWWGGSNPPPPHLKTKKQLADMGLKPVSAVGVIEARKYDLLLYDPENPESVRPSKKPTVAQLRNLEKGRRKQAYKNWFRDEGFLYRDENEAIVWARKFVADPDSLVLDTETTGLRDPQIVEIAILNLQGEILFHSLVKPAKEIEPGAEAVHGISNAEVADKPTFADISPQLSLLLTDKKIATYNVGFDFRALRCSRQAANLPQPKYEDQEWECAMHWYAQFCGEYGGRSDRHDRFAYRWQRLPSAGHRAVADCLALIDLLRKMAATEPRDLGQLFDRHWEEICKS